MHPRALPYTETDPENDPATLPLSTLAIAGRAWIDDGESLGLSPNTLANRRGVVDRLAVYLQREGHERCGPNEIRAYLAAVRRSGARPVTVLTYHDEIRTWFRFIVAERLIAANPFDRIKRPRAQEDRITPFTPEQLQALLAATRDACHPSRAEAMVMILLDTGCRATGICRLKCRDVDLTSRRMTVLGKGNKTRPLPFGRRCARSIWTYLQKHPRDADEPLFTSLCGYRPGEALTRYGIYQFVAKLGRAAGIQAVRASPHTFRHTFAIEFLRAGGNVFALKEILGHNSLTMVNRYVKIAQADIENQHRAFSPADRLPRRTDRG